MGSSSGDRSVPRHPVRWRAVTVLTLAGGAAFWFANFAISRTSIAAEYRAALSISYVPMLLGALLGGLIIGLGVSVVLLRFFDGVPGQDPLRKSILLSVVALLIVTLLIEIPATLSTATRDALRYFVIGAVFNTIRILALGAVIGSLYRGLAKRGRLNKAAPGPEVDR
jgi:hypothetical protein